MEYFQTKYKKDIASKYPYQSKKKKVFSVIEMPEAPELPKE